MNKNVLKRAIMVAWMILVICFVVKALGGNWFALNITSTWLEEHRWVTVCVSTLTSYVLFNLYYLAICRVRNFPLWIHLAMIPYFFMMSSLKVFVIPPRFCVVIDLLSNFVLPFVLVMRQVGMIKAVNKDEYFRIVVAFCLNSGFQLISTLVRDVSVTVVVTSYAAQLILTFDVFIMLALYWFYSLLNKKEVDKMSIFFTLLLGKGKDELEQMLKDVVAKLEVDPDNETLKEEKEVIESAIKEL